MFILVSSIHTDEISVDGDEWIEAVCQCGIQRLFERRLPFHTLPSNAWIMGHDQSNIAVYAAEEPDFQINEESSEACAVMIDYVAWIMRQICVKYRET